MDLDHPDDTKIKPPTARGNRPRHPITLGPAPADAWLGGAPNWVAAPERSIRPTHAECTPHRSHAADMPLHALRHAVVAKRAANAQRPGSDRASDSRGTHRRDARYKAGLWSQCQQRRSA
jgi:hypothetical protein